MKDAGLVRISDVHFTAAEHQPQQKNGEFQLDGSPHNNPEPEERLEADGDEERAPIQGTEQNKHVKNGTHQKPGSASRGQKQAEQPAQAQPAQAQPQALPPQQQKKDRPSRETAKEGAQRGRPPKNKESGKGGARTKRGQHATVEPAGPSDAPSPTQAVPAVPSVSSLTSTSLTSVPVSSPIPLAEGPTTNQAPPQVPPDGVVPPTLPPNPPAMQPPSTPQPHIQQSFPPGPQPQHPLQPPAKMLSPSASSQAPPLLPGSPLSASAPGDMVVLVEYKGLHYKLRGPFGSMDRFRSLTRERVPVQGDFNYTFLDPEFEEMVVLQDIEDLQHKMKLRVLKTSDL